MKKVGQQVKIVDGSYMKTVRDGKLTSSDPGSEHNVIGKNTDTWTILATGLRLPEMEIYKPFLGNKCNTIIQNNGNGDIWFCNAKINLVKV